MTTSKTETGAEASTKDEAPTKDEAQTRIKARVLRDYAGHRAGAVVEFYADAIAAAEAAGWLDSDPAAVAYAESMAK